MNKRKIIIIVLFFMSFSVVHEYFFAMYDREHTSISEYVYEQEMPTDHKDLCDAHFEYHVQYILPDVKSLYTDKTKTQLPHFRESRYNFHKNYTFLKPPISIA